MAMTKTQTIGPVRVSVDMHRDIRLLCQIRNVDVGTYTREALERLIERDIANYETGYKALLEMQRRLDEEVDRQRKAS